MQKNTNNRPALYVVLFIIVFIVGLFVGTQTTIPQAETPTIEPAQNTKPEPIHLEFTANSSKATEPFTLRQGLAIVKLKYTGDSNFIVASMDTAGERREGLVNEIGSFDGSKAVRIETAGEYLLNVDQAQGDWTVMIDQK